MKTSVTVLSLLVSASAFAQVNNAQPLFPRPPVVGAEPRPLTNFGNTNIFTGTQGIIGGTAPRSTNTQFGTGFRTNPPFGVVPGFTNQVRGLTGGPPSAVFPNVPPVPDVPAVPEVPPGGVPTLPGVVPPPGVPPNLPTNPPGSGLPGTTPVLPGTGPIPTLPGTVPTLPGTTPALPGTTPGLPGTTPGLGSGVNTPPPATPAQPPRIPLTPPRR